jgi:hypothetical protein
MSRMAFDRVRGERSKFWGAQGTTQYGSTGLRFVVFFRPTNASQGGSNLDGQQSQHKKAPT